MKIKTLFCSQTLFRFTPRTTSDDAPLVVVGPALLRKSFYTNARLVQRKLGRQYRSIAHIVLPLSMNNRRRAGRLQRTLEAYRAAIRKAPDVFAYGRGAHAFLLMNGQQRLIRHLYLFAPKSRLRHTAAQCERIYFFNPLRNRHRLGVLHNLTIVETRLSLRPKLSLLAATLRDYLRHAHVSPVSS